MKRMLWYASYGSNLLEERFDCYIRGGKPEGADRIYKGSIDPTPPARNKKIIIDAEVYFARNSKTWHGGGIAFIDPNEKGKTLGRMYLINEDQFLDLVKQESRFEGNLILDLQKAEKQGSLILDIRSWYGKLLLLGHNEGYPVFTFTNELNLGREINPPHKHYLKIIIKGLRQTYSLNDEEVRQYLGSKKGISKEVLDEVLL